MLLAGALAWMLHGTSSPPPAPPIVRPPTEAVSEADEQTEAPRETTPTPEERVTEAPFTVTTPQRATATPTAPTVDLLVERWLARYCREVEGRHQERGREPWRCSWQDVQISGALPKLEVDFTRVDRTAEEARGAALEVLVREQFRLICADPACRRLTVGPAKSVAAAVKESGAAAPTQMSTEGRNRPPVVEILTVPQRAVAGQRVVLKARVTDPDSAMGDRIECAWSVDGKELTRLCWEFVWTVPATPNRGNVTFTLKARDRHGASDSESVSVLIGRSESPLGQAPEAAATSQTPVHTR